MAKVNAVKQRRLARKIWEKVCANLEDRSLLELGVVDGHLLDEIEDEQINDIQLILEDEEVAV